MPIPVGEVCGVLDPADSHCEATRALGVDLDSHCEATRANVIQGMDLVYSQTKSRVDSCDLHLTAPTIELTLGRRLG